MKRVGLVGVTGYTGMELVRVLLGHPDMRLTRVTSRKEAGRMLRDIYPFLHGMDAGEIRIAAPDSGFLAEHWPFLTARPWRWPQNCGKKERGWWI